MVDVYINEGSPESSRPKRVARLGAAETGNYYFSPKSGEATATVEGGEPQSRIKVSVTGVAPLSDEAIVLVTKQTRQSRSRLLAFVGRHLGQKSLQFCWRDVGDPDSYRVQPDSIQVFADRQLSVITPGDPNAHPFE